MDYLSIDACHMGIVWRPVAGDSESTTHAKDESQAQLPPSTLHEPILVRSRDPSASARQAIFQVFPDLNEYGTGDLFAPHPTRPHTWKFAGRTDDLILFGHGIKFHPAGIEAKIQQSHGWFQDVLMLGDRHQQAVLLIELTEVASQDMKDEQNKVKMRGELDSLLDRVNEEAPVMAQIAKTHVIFATSEKPLPRTSKGSVKRKEAAKVYQAEVEEVYRKFGDKMGKLMSRVQ